MSTGVILRTKHRVNLSPATQMWKGKLEGRNKFQLGQFKKISARWSTSRWITWLHNAFPLSCHNPRAYAVCAYTIHQLQKTVPAIGNCQEDLLGSFRAGLFTSSNANKALMVSTTVCAWTSDKSRSTSQVTHNQKQFSSWNLVDRQHRKFLITLAISNVTVS